MNTTPLPPLHRKGDVVWEMARTGDMKVPGRIYADSQMIDDLHEDQSLMQVRNVACLPGIVRYSMAMPDIHFGYGFPIGGVAAFRMDSGVVSPGGVGYDINCGVRLLGTSLTADDITGRVKGIVDQFFRDVPAGVGSAGAIAKLSRAEVSSILVKGAAWAVEHGYGRPADLAHTEAEGCLPGADPELISDRAFRRGLDQVGTLGSGNHFLELQIVDKIFAPEAATAFGLRQGQITLMVHCGSRGFGYQVCDDYLEVMEQAAHRYEITIPDRQLACAPLSSSEGKAYLSAMACAANYAWTNRQILTHLVERALMKTLSVSRDSLDLQLVYDVAHNIAKIERHEVDGETLTLCVHRKGATRAFGPDQSEVPADYRSVGQPVLIPGDMGTASYVCVGTQTAMEETFGSTCHGAGRVLSRTQALKRAKGRSIDRELKQHGIVARAQSRKTLAEEMPEAYKDVDSVVDVMHRAGVSLRVARLRPLGVVKG